MEYAGHLADRQLVTKSISILGATGSVGGNTLQIIRDAGSQAFSIAALAAGKNAEKLAELALEFRPKFVALADESGAKLLTDRLTGSEIEIGIGRAAVIEAGARETDLVVAAITGAAGLEPTLAAVQQGTAIALANKECLVCAGDLFMHAARRNGSLILPVDSEHNAIFQVLNQKRRSDVAKLILTASGGPFRSWTLAEIQNASKADALAHPVWDMGAKITIDSATMMNKGLELIEAAHLFGRASDEIEILVHPQSIVHSMVAYIDGSVLAQMGTPDMRTPIAYALAWPNRMPSGSAPLDLAALGTLTFEPPDSEKFPSLRLARNALESGGAAQAVLNAANEVAVDALLMDKISFAQIPLLIDKTLNALSAQGGFGNTIDTLAGVLHWDNTARRTALEYLGS